MLILERFGSQFLKHYFAALSMKKNRKPYNHFQLVSAICMILALLWLTVSNPFVYASQEKAKQCKMANASSPMDASDEESANPLGNSSEEKNPNSNTSFSEEYLHDHHVEEYSFSITSQYHKCENSDTYIAFHGELLVPPPNVA